MWLSHHYPEDYDRCVLVGRTHVCRRCLVLYPVALLALAVAAQFHRSTLIDALLGGLLPLPAVIDFTLENLDLVGYRPRRQLIVTAPLGVALGVGLDRYFRRHFDPLFWGLAIGYCAVCVVALILGARRRRRRAMESTGSL